MLYNAVLRSPLIFLRLAESSVGEMDMLVTPYVPHFDPLSTSTRRSKFEFFNLNATALDLELEPLSAVSGSAPRWVLQGKAASQRDPQTVGKPSGRRRLRVCMHTLKLKHHYTQGPFQTFSYL